MISEYELQSGCSGSRASHANAPPASLTTATNLAPKIRDLHLTRQNAASVFIAAILIPLPFNLCSIPTHHFYSKKSCYRSQFVLETFTCVRCLNQVGTSIMCGVSVTRLCNSVIGSHRLHRTNQRPSWPSWRAQGAVGRDPLIQAPCIRSPGNLTVFYF